MTLRNVFLAVIISSVGVSPCFASSANLGVMTYHGRIVLSNGSPLVAPNVTFRIQIRSPGNENCLLYEEDHILDMSKSDGVFALNIGAGTPSSASTRSLSKVFSNKGEHASGLSCSVGSSYIPNSSDSRRLVISFNDGTGYQTLQVQQINSVPFSLESQQVGGYDASSLLRVENGFATSFNQAQFNELVDLVQGQSVQYTKPGQLLNGNLPTSLQENETLKWDGTKWITHTLTGSASGTLTNITAGTGLMANGVSGGQIDVSGTLALTNTGVTAGTYGAGASVPSFEVDAQGRILSVTNVPISSSEGFSGALAGDVSGTQGATSVDKVKGVSVSSLTPLSGQFLKLDSGSWTPHFVSLMDIKSSVNPASDVFPTNCSTSQTLQYSAVDDTFTCANITVSAFSGALNGDVTGSQTATVVSSVGGVTAAQIAAGANLANQATNTNVADSLVRRDASGNFIAGTITANLNGHATSATSFIGSLNGDVTGTQGATVVSSVGGQSASNVASGSLAANQATEANVSDKIVRRDTSGNFSAGTISADLIGNVTGNVSGSSASFTGTLSGDISGTQNLTSVDKIKGNPVAAGTPVAAGNTLRWTGAHYAPGFLSLADIRNGTSEQQFPTNCNTEQTMVYNAINDKYECQNITLVSSTNVLNGDVVGSVSNNNVIALQGRPVSVNAPFVNQILKWDGTQWLPSNEDGLTGRIAGGDLTGSYPNPTVAAGAINSAKIANNTIVDANISATAAISDTKLATIVTAGKVANSATTATNSNTANTIVLRDGSGNFSAGTITANLNGNATSATTATTATTATDFTGNLAGDVTGTQNATTVERIQGRAVASTAPGTGQVLKWNGSSWAPATDDPGVTGSGSTNYIPKWSSGTALGNSTISDDGSAMYSNGRNVALGGSGSAYSLAPIEVRTATPRVSFHWPGVVASQIGMDSGGTIRTYDNPGTGFAPFAAGNVTAYGSVTATSDVTASGQVYAGGWFRSYGNQMIYSQTYGIGWSPDSGVMNVYGAARIGNLQNPINPYDAATKTYVDTQVAAISPGARCSGRFTGEIWTNDGGYAFTGPGCGYGSRYTYQCVNGAVRTLSVMSGYSCY